MIFRIARSLHNRIALLFNRLTRSTRSIFLFLFVRNIVVHLGMQVKVGKKLCGNVGDPYLYLKLEQLIDSLSTRKIHWVYRRVDKPLTRFEILLYNLRVKAVLVGGHGLLMVDEYNPNSGWMFNTSIDVLRKLKTPIVFEAIGFNPFRGQRRFDELFRRHINFCVEKAVAFGLRNEGSIRALNEYLSEENKKRITLQPCPTTVVSCFGQPVLRKASSQVAVCLAFDRFENRFGGEFTRVLSDLREYAKWCSEIGMSIIFYVHHTGDLYTDACRQFLESGFPVSSIAEVTEQELVDFYLSKQLVVGMRGHSLMIPWGLGIPCVSITTQDKQRFFMELVKQENLDIDVMDSNLLQKLKAATSYVVDHREDVLREMRQRQEELWQLTKTNLEEVLGKVGL